MAAVARVDLQRAVQDDTNQNKGESMFGVGASEAPSNGFTLSLSEPTE